eukprot:CAMPEP_0182895818 /NCGR_PEP_ID=MMETSP0034_2-20130328/25914_1 /TAXON_ID=156128 /ORGANISM="Nephroselmis pyriformis, Strain CCMP717" /LENGTH=31 /DNA_ID= /DNA_START= /DNA_END= /DNA_ORIENTATION=
MPPRPAGIPVDDDRPGPVAGSATGRQTPDAG